MRPFPAADKGASPSVLAIASAAPLDPRAAAVLERQARVLDLQIASSERHAKLRRLTLRLGALSTVMKVALEVAVAFIFLVIAAFLAGAIWKATQDDALVIEAFDVPPDLVTRGLSGEVVASQLQDRLSAMHLHSSTTRAANKWRSDIRVQIPATGISIGEAYRFLAAWLGNRTEISGDLWHDGGDRVLAVRVEEAPAKRFRAPAGSLDALIMRAADFVYGQTPATR